MKNTKNRVLSLASIVVLMSAQSSNGAQQMAEKSAALTAQLSTQNPGFELYNKSRNTITYRIGTGNTTAEQSANIKTGTINPGAASRQNIALSLGATITITVNGIARTFYIAQKRKSLYLSWNPDDKSHAANPLYPQTGKKMGLSGETESGLPIGFMGATNVKQSEITEANQPKK